MRSLGKALLPVLAALAGSVAARAQVTVGAPPLGTVVAGQGDFMDYGSLNVGLSIPLVSLQGRLLPFSYGLSFNNSIWSPTSGGWLPSPGLGWGSLQPAVGGHLAYNATLQTCSGGYYGTQFYTLYDNIVFYSVDGTSHPFANAATDSPDPVPFCSGAYSMPMVFLATDNSGYTVDMSSQTVTGPDGTGYGPTYVTDRNGNYISQTTSGGATTVTDTLGNTALTVTSYTSYATIDWPGPAGGTAQATVYFTSFPMLTAFGCSGVSEYSNVYWQYLPTSIVLPEGTSYTFTYERTPGTLAGGYYYTTGRLASVTFPTGGSIAYSYTGSNDGIDCADGSTMGLTRVVSDGVNSWTWNYSRSVSGSTSTTTVADASSTHTTTLDFQAPNVLDTTGTLYGYLETGSSVQDGSTVLSTTETCYNSSCSSVPSTAVSELTTYTTLNPATADRQSETDALYNTYGAPTALYEYDFGTGSPGGLLRSTGWNYATLSGVYNLPSSIVVYDGAMTRQAETDFAYDATAVASTGGSVPNLGTPAGARGNATSVSRWVVGTASLTGNYTYFDTGQISGSEDVNGAWTTYNYGSNSCNHAFTDSIGEPLSLTRSMTWDCSAEVQVTAEDESSNTTTLWHDAYGRTTQVQDAAGNNTYTRYPNSTAPNQSETWMPFNGGASTRDVLTTIDGLGRPQVQQVKEGPSATNWDSIETDYDESGNVAQVSAPYVALAGALAPSGTAFTTQTWDSLGRPELTTDAGGGTVNKSYVGGDELITLGPAPTDENAKQRQFEYDGIGRLTSVCELTSASGSGTCGQHPSQTGFWTTYTNNTAGQITAVTQNAQAGSGHQTRSFGFDGLGRLTSETNPETGAVAYGYDSDATCGTSAGDMVKRVDAMSNLTCTAYDALHRPTAVTYPSGPYAGATVARHFVYDAATVDGASMSNVKGRLAEAWTGTTSTVTDEGFSYDQNGSTTDTWQESPYSGGYYHLSSTWWPNGALETYSGLGTSTKTYGIDAMGRVNSLSDAGFTDPVPPSSPIQYNVSGQPVAIWLGSGDSDHFSYDAATGRMATYQYTVGSQTDTGTLSWNPNGSLASIGYTDSIPGTSDDGTSCDYSEDDLGRVASMTCGTSWDQTFNDDAFGNVDKTALPGALPFDATYNLNNQIASDVSTIGTFTPSYDANGNLLDDPVTGTTSAYEWDAEGRPVDLAGNVIVTDALGRIVETQTGSANYQEVYAPDGSKVAWMDGATMLQFALPIPGGGTALDTIYGVSMYLHPDWLGTGRLWSTASGTLGAAGDPAAYGESWLPVFTGNWQDAVTGIADGLYDFPFREYSAPQSRWLTPDPAGLAAVDPTDPQTWNRYAYVRGNPLEMTDPTGLLGTLGMSCLPGATYGYADDGGATTVFNCTPIDGDPPDDGDPGDDSGGGGGGGGGNAAQPFGPIPPPKPCKLVAPGGHFIPLDRNVIALFQPAMANALTNVFNLLNANGIVPQINSGFRSVADQLRMRNGASGPNPAAVVSWHQAGMAVDINGTASSFFQQVVNAMVGQGLTWGGTFSHTDLQHFQLAPAGTTPSMSLVSACAGGS